MDKRTLLAVVLSVVVITAGFIVQNVLYPPQPPPPAQQQPADGSEQVTETPGPEAEERGEAGDIATVEGEPDENLPAGVIRPVPLTEEPEDERFVYENDTLRVRFSPVGGAVESFELLEYPDGDEPVEMILRGTDEQRAFTLAFGGADAEPIDARFFRRDTTEEHVVEFYRDFYVTGEEEAPFRLIKRYSFEPGEYLFELDVTLEHSQNAVVPLNFSGTAYTLTVGPQIGPSYQILDDRNEYRRFHYLEGRSRENVNIRGDGSETLDERVGWAAIAGKYFSIIGVPDATRYDIVFSQRPAEGLEDTAFMSFVRPTIRSSRSTDRYRFYVGPKTTRVLERYNDASANAFEAQNLNLDTVVDRRFLFGWLENILKWVLTMIVQVVPNYGIAIIILTVIVKALLFPLTHKSYESTSKMQTIQPKVQELREKYKDNPQKMNAEMANLYKKEGVNPVGGCLPMLLQFPFFIAMFGLFNNHFDLRGATFIPGWINDLSAPDSILSFDTTIPIIGWNDIRLLPVLFLGSQILTSMLMQNSTAQSTGQMKFMQYGLPVMFFFILYNMPSGLLVYWIFSNLLTLGQQMIINKRRTQTSAA
ncbi:MAG: membrane protein insertase YidC [Alkalispirochaetaceae bacterium]